VTAATVGKLVKKYKESPDFLADIEAKSQAKRAKPMAIVDAVGAFRDEDMQIWNATQVADRVQADTGMEVKPRQVQ